MTPRLAATAAVAVAVVGASLGCGGEGGASGRGTTRLRVLAAASLTDVLTDIGGRFEEAHPGTTVRYSFGPSSALAAQAVDGAPADVLATADRETMRRAVEGGAVDGAPVVFATNRLALAVPAGNPAGVRGVDALADGDLFVGLCAAPVPCGRAARRLLDEAGVRPAPDTEEPDVRALLTKLEAGELDVGLVYRTDVVAAGDRVDELPLPPGLGGTTTYEIAVLVSSDHPSTAAALIELVRSGAGRRALVGAGFGVP